MRPWFKTLLISAALHGAALTVFAAAGKLAVERPQPIRVRLIQMASGVGTRAPQRLASAPAAPAQEATDAAAQKVKKKKVRPSVHRPSQHSPQAAPTGPAPQAAPAASQSGPVFASAPRAAGAVGGTAVGSARTAGLGPRLLRSSVSDPGYAHDALNAGFEGILAVDVVIDADGKVISVHLVNPSGYEIDAGVLAAARAARYQPARDVTGLAIAAATRLNFDFRIP